MTFTENPQIDLAYEYVRNTNKNIFLTGKAGTGKTTFLHNLKNEGLKRMVIVAPTGVAAINAGGMTIHSFFQLPFGLWLPDTPRDAQQQQRKFAGDKIRIIKSLDLLVIDEISMVRADMLDSIDEVLRKFRDPYKPFGGVQLLMIGDLHQLPPIVKDEEWVLLRKHYKTAYFFDSLALQKTDPVSIELKHIYRQSDTTFVDLLNRVRDNKIDEAVLAQLNSRYIPDFQPPPDQHYITLTAVNAAANLINEQRLAVLTQSVRIFKAKVEGDFPAFSYPTEIDLALKIGAQVMFVKNDIGPEKRFYNGKIGKIMGMTDEEITISCPGDMAHIVVKSMTWENIKYSLDETAKEVREDLQGSFTQMPLKLAWAITIHKSQGLTFERAIIDAQSAFAHGQVYVALSRCKTFEGIVLKTRIQSSSVKTDSTVKQYSEESERNAPDQQHLENSKHAYQAQLIAELFDFKELKRALGTALRTFDESANALGHTPLKLLREVQEQVQNHVTVMAARFIPQLEVYFQDTVLPEANIDLQERLKKASTYFKEHLANTEILLKQVTVMTDNKEIRKRATEHLTRLKKEAFLRLRAFELCSNGFDTVNFIRQITNAELDFTSTQAVSQADTKRAPRDVPHPELFMQLTKWRDDTAELLGVEQYEVLPAKSLRQLVEQLPTDGKHLSRISGIGAVKLKQFGGEIITIVEQYCRKFQLASNLAIVAETALKIPKDNTKMISLNLFREGKSIEQIAKERSMVPGTIMSHLAAFVKSGDLDVLKLISREKLERIESYMIKHQGATAGSIKEALRDDSYEDIRLVTNYLIFKGVSNDGGLEE
jgi:PIF1-like helicase/Helix-turn-helix domain/HRDC domain